MDDVRGLLLTLFPGIQSLRVSYSVLQLEVSVCMAHVPQRCVCGCNMTRDILDLV